MEWNYWVSKKKFNDLQEHLDIMGDASWELVSAFMFDPDHTEIVGLIFKRPQYKEIVLTKPHDE